MRLSLIFMFFITPLIGQTLDTVLRAKLQGVQVQEFLPPSVLRIDSFKTSQSGEWIVLTCFATLSDNSTISGDILRFKIHGIKTDKAKRPQGVPGGTSFTGFMVTAPDADGYYTSKAILRTGTGDFYDTIPLIKAKLSGIGLKTFDAQTKALSGFQTAGPDANGFVYLIGVYNSALGYYEPKPPSDKFQGEVKLIKDFFLYNISPNPVKNSTKIKFSVKEETDVKIEIYDINGRLIKEVLNKTLKPGIYQISWGLEDNNGEKVKEGIYFIKYKAKDKTFIRKFSVISE